MTAATMTYEDTVNLLVEWQADGADQDLVIYSYDDPHRARIRLLEISDDYFAHSGAETWSVTYGPSPEVPFVSTIALITHEQWRHLRDGRPKLPEGWSEATPRKVWPNGHKG